MLQLHCAASLAVLFCRHFRSPAMIDEVCHRNFSQLSCSTPNSAKFEVSEMLCPSKFWRVFGIPNTLQAPLCVALWQIKLFRASSLETSKDYRQDVGHLTVVVIVNEIDVASPDWWSVGSSTVERMHQSKWLLNHQYWSCGRLLFVCLQRNVLPNTVVLYCNAVLSVQCMELQSTTKCSASLRRCSGLV